MKKIILCLLVLASPFLASSQTFSGPTSVCPQVAYNYSVSSNAFNPFSQWTISPPEAGVISNPNSRNTTITWNANYSSAVLTADHHVSDITRNISITSINANISGGNPTFLCVGSSVQLSVSNSSGSTFQWYKDGVFQSGATSAQFAATSAGSYTVSVSRAGCTVTSQPRTVYEVQPPVPGINGPVNVQKGTINNVYTTESGMSNYVWSIPPTTGTVSASGNVATVTWRKIGVHTIKVDYTGGPYGCRSASDGIQVTVIPVPGQEDVIPVRNYDGTIASVRWRTSKVDGSTGEDMKGMYTFEYDDKYQLKGAQWAVPDFTLSLFSNEGDQFRIANLAYDPNGNIQSMRRYDSTGARINDFAYTYNAKITKPQQTNQLQNITGYAAYSYDTLGRLIAEDKVSGADQYIEYDVSGKVLKVFSDAAKQNTKVEYIYDDRGFRLAKKDIANGKTTWYIRDASGNLLSVYESANGSDQAKQIEAPVYGSGKIGTYYPKQESSGYYQDGSTDYEISDHLSNVRTLVRDNINSYGASMEDSGQPMAANPRVKEMQHFINLFETEQTDVYMNHTPATAAVSNPNRSAYLFWQSGVQGTDASDKSIGPGIMLKVKAGDKVKAETWVRYEKKTSYSRGFDLLLLSQFLGTNFVGIGGFEGYTVVQATNTFQSALTGGNFMSDGTDEERPFAYLNYILFNQNMTLADAGWQRIPQNAGHLSGQEALPGMHQRVAFDEALEMDANGYIYVWVSNESENTKVWFDDLKVTHQESIVIQSTDYGVWGDVIREQKSTQNNYRYGYQGQFAEKDAETGWSHFELRQYDPSIGRWTTRDPMVQYWSPYIGMGNNPVNGTDPNGGKFFSDFVNAKTGEKRHIDDGIDRVVTVEDENWSQFLRLLELTEGVFSDPYQRFGILEKFGSMTYDVGSAINVYKFRLENNPNRFEWGAQQFSENGRAFINPDRNQDDTDGLINKVTILTTFDPREKATVHFHYSPLVEEQPSSDDLNIKGYNVYNIVISPSTVYFFNRGDYFINKFGRSKWRPNGADFSIPRSAFKNQ